MRVLISAYACDPSSGSEGGHGWHYAHGLARRGHDVHVITPERWKEKVLAELARTSSPRPTFHYVREPVWPLRLGWTVGSGLRYVLWQWSAANSAVALDRDHDFHVVHHVSYGTLLGGSFMWRLGKPLVFGPCGGGQTAPAAFLGYFGRFRSAEVGRSLVTRCLWAIDWPAVKTARAAAVVLACNPETARLARRMGARRVEPMLDVYLPDDLVSSPVARSPRPRVRLLWVGRFLGRKGHRLTVEALDLVPPSVPVELVMVGDGPAEAEFRQWLAASPPAHPVALVGRLPWMDVHQAYDDADIFVFTPLRDSVGAQLLEAMAHSLPVVTLDHQGAAVLVGSDAGIKVLVTSPVETRRGVTDAIVRLATAPGLRTRLGAAGLRRARQLTLGRHLERLEAVYARVCDEERAPCARESAEGTRR